MRPIHGAERHEDSCGGRELDGRLAHTPVPRCTQAFDGLSADQQRGRDGGAPRFLVRILWLADPCERMGAIRSADAGVLYAVPIRRFRGKATRRWRRAPDRAAPSAESSGSSALAPWTDRYV